MEARVVLEVKPFDVADSRYEQLKVSVLGACNQRHETVEAMIAEGGRWVLLALFESFLTLCGLRKVAGSVIDTQGREHPEVRRHERSVTSVFGDARFSRDGHNLPGVGSLHPVDAALNLPREQYSYGVRLAVVRHVVHISYGVVGASLEQSIGVRVNQRQLEELTARAAADVAEFYEQRRTSKLRLVLPAKRIVVITADAKGVVLRKEDLREATRKAAESRRPRMFARKSPGEKSNSKRMAQVVATYDVDPFVRTAEEFLDALRPTPGGEKPVRPKPRAKWMMASLVVEPEVLMARGFEEAEARDPEHQLTWVVLVDGDFTQIRRIKKIARRFRVKVTIVCDIIHVAEYLWKAGRGFIEESSPALESWVLDHLERILQGEASSVAAGIRRSATLRKLSAARRKGVDRCADYLINHAKYLHYHQYLAAGYPIATGVIEGGIRHLIRDRMDITGARWSLSGAEAVLKLRATALNGDLEEYLKFHLDQEYHRVHESQYQGDLPTPLTPVPGQPIVRTRKAGPLRPTN
jgi:hypothetical protein